MSTFSQRMTETVARFLQEGERPPLPAGGDLLWHWFADLSAGRSYHAYGPNPIGWAEIEAYMRVTRWPLQMRHIAIIRAMDRTYLAFDRAERRMPSSKPQGRPMSPALFDAIFG